MNYINIFQEYKEINLSIIKSIRENNEDLYLFEKREKIIEKIFSLGIDKTEIKKIYLQQKLDVLDKELEDIIREKIIWVKAEIKQINAKKQANLGYASVNRVNNFFSKRV